MNLKPNAIRRPLKGFTLLETLIAITVLSFAIVGPFQIAQGVLRTSQISRDQLTATALAQEGMEYIRSVRDGNMLYNLHQGGTRTPFYGFDSTSATDCFANSCVVDPSANTQSVCATSSCSTRPLYLSATGLYNQQSSGTLTKFVRKVQFSTLNATSTKVTVTVSWTAHGSYSVVLSEVLTNWI